MSNPTPQHPFPPSTSPSTLLASALNSNTRRRRPPVLEVYFPAAYNLVRSSYAGLIAAEADATFSALLFILLLYSSIIGCLTVFTRSRYALLFREPYTRVLELIPDATTVCHCNNRLVALVIPCSVPINALLRCYFWTVTNHYACDENTSSSCAHASALKYLSP